MDANLGVLHLLYSGEEMCVLDNYPELASFRDTIFMFKARVAPCIPHFAHYISQFF